MPESIVDAVTAEAVAAAPVLAGRQARLILRGQWVSCWLSEITPRGAVVEVDRPLKPGDKVVACVPEVGALAGFVSEAGNGRCAVAFTGYRPDAPARMPEAYARV